MICAPIHINMELMEKCVDYGDAPTILATGVCRIFFISRHIVRITVVRTDVDDNGVEQQRVSGHMDWDISDLRAAHAAVHEVLDEILSSPPPRRRQKQACSAAH